MNAVTQAEIADELNINKTTFSLAYMGAEMDAAKRETFKNAVDAIVRARGDEPKMVIEL